MEQAGKYLFRIVSLGLLGALATSGGCMLAQIPGPQAIGTAAGTFLNAVGFLLLVAAIVIMVVWAMKSVRS